MYTYEKCQSYTLGEDKKKSKLGLERAVPRPQGQKCICDGISARRCFCICTQVLVVALGAILVMFTCFILSPVLGCRAVIQLIIDQHIKRFLKRRDLGLWSLW